MPPQGMPQNMHMSGPPGHQQLPPPQMYPSNGMPMNMYPGHPSMSTAPHTEHMSRNMSPSHRTRD